MGSDDRQMGRRDLIRQTAALGLLIGTTACARGQSALGSFALGYRPALQPLRISADRIMELKTCLRPFRPQGPRLDSEQSGDTLIIHNYGHGGSGWSLSWGSADIAVQKAMASLPGEIAVIGCGIIGLTTAIVAQRAGAKVTIYTRDLLWETRSVRATGGWTPDSRIALSAPAGPAFGALWEQMARRSYHEFRAYAGLAGKPVDFGDNYILSDQPMSAHAAEAANAAKGDYASTGMPQSNSEFGHYMDRIHDITPALEAMEPGSTPFKQKFVSRTSRMFFNFSSYGELLMQQFRSAGGQVVMRNFRSPAQLAELKEKVVINCPGYAARDLWKDKTLIPVRGQTAWLIPDPEMNYGVIYKGFAATSKADGIVVQGIGGSLGELAGVGDGNEVPDPEEAFAAIRTLQEVFPAPSTHRS